MTIILHETSTSPKPDCEPVDVYPWDQHDTETRAVREMADAANDDQGMDEFGHWFLPRFCLLALAGVIAAIVIGWL